MAKQNLVFHLLDVYGRVGDDDRAEISGHLGHWMMDVARRKGDLIGSVSISWWTRSGRPRPGPIDIVMYIVPDVGQSKIAVNGGDVSGAEANPRLGGLTAEEDGSRRQLSEGYWDRAFSSREMAGIAFHEAAHNKSRQGDEMHRNQDGFLRAAPVYAGGPTEKNLKFLADHVLTEVQQWIVQ